MYVSGFESSPYGIEWVRFEPDSPVSALIRSVPHIAFEVDDLEAALEGKQILAPVSSPSDGVRVAMILDNGAPVELLEFRSAERPRRRGHGCGVQGRGQTPCGIPRKDLAMRAHQCVGRVTTKRSVETTSFT